MTEHQLLAKLKKDARRIAKRFNLRYLDIVPESPRVTSRCGSCTDEHEIRIRLYALGTGRFLSYPFLVDTLCHEMAHLRHFNHGKGFKELYAKILAWAKRHGIYDRRKKPRKN